MAGIWSILAVALVAIVASTVSEVSAAGECAAKAAVSLAHWSFDGTYDDLSRNQRGPAIGAWDRAPVGGNINLAWDDAAADDSCAGFVRVGNPGFLEVPRVDFYDTSFTFSFSIRLNGAMADRRILYADWSKDQWQFMSWVTPSRQISVWMRNGKQDTFVYVSSFTTVTLGVWTDIAFNWDRSARTASIYINRQKVGSQTVAANVADINLFKSSTYYYQFGSKADSANQDAKDYSPLEADLKNLRVFKGFILVGDSQPELVMSSA